ncbi:hypothetical protein BKA63DRAFT_509638 [Paraphoma chrysanthemicola]|nr:hypothetical protein BKA63DRAFT_509638 [Paraphoma chrysanthemicola]
MSTSRLFTPLKVGNLELKNRVAMAPLTRFRASDDHVILPMAAEYYGQRASVPGTLLISEATIVTPEHGGFPNVPCLQTQEQIDAWRKVTDEVHKKGSFIFSQLWALGRVANPHFTKARGFTVKGASPIALDSEHEEPQEMTEGDIEQTIAAFAQAAKNAIAAGFDGVEIHGANGYLVDQFIQDRTNHRTDRYGGSIENRSRFAFEVTQAVANAIGAQKTAIRLSPFSDYQGMHMEKDTIPQFSNIIKKLNSLGLAYIHLVEARVNGTVDRESSDSLDPLLSVYNGTVLVAGGFQPESARRFVDEEHKRRDVVVVFGRYFISTPDIVFRLKEGIDLNPYDRNTFYNAKEERGYLDQPFSKQFLEIKANV